MTRLGESLWSVSLAARIGMFDPNPVDAFEDDDRTFWRSFWAVPAVLILTVAIAAMAFRSEVEAETARSPLTLGWLVISLLVALHIAAEFARIVGRFDRWPRYVIIQNWTSLVQNFVLAVVLVVLGLIGAAQNIVEFAMIAVGCWALAFDWYVIRRSLDVSGGQAALLTAILLASRFAVDRIASSFSSV